jgi:hypothetical protein
MDKTGAVPLGNHKRGDTIQQKRLERILTRSLECLGMQAKKRLRVPFVNKRNGTTLIVSHTWGRNSSNWPKKSFRKFRKHMKSYQMGQVEWLTTMVVAERM